MDVGQFTRVSLVVASCERSKDMRKTILSAVLASTVVLGASSLHGCASWWQNFKDDPVAQVQAFEQGVQVVMADLQIAWTVLKPMLPPDTAAKVEAQYVRAVAAVNHALHALNDAVMVAVEAQEKRPDFAKLMVAVADAVGEVIKIIDLYRTAAPSADAGPPTAFGEAGATMGASRAPADLPGLEDAKKGHAALKLRSTR